VAGQGLAGVHNLQAARVAQCYGPVVAAAAHLPMPMRSRASCRSTSRTDTQMRPGLLTFERRKPRMSASPIWPAPMKPIRSGTKVRGLGASSLEVEAAAAAPRAALVQVPAQCEALFAGAAAGWVEVGLRDHASCCKHGTTASGCDRRRRQCRPHLAAMVAPVSLLGRGCRLASSKPCAIRDKRGASWSLVRQHEIGGCDRE
jgi:hypothetical protein